MKDQSVNILDSTTTSIGVRLQVAVDDRDLRERIDHALAFNGYDRLVSDAGDIHLVARAGSMPEPPRGEPDFLLPEGISIYVESDGAEYHSAECHAKISFGRALIELDIPASGYPRADLLVYAIVPMMARFGYYGLHAAAVAAGTDGVLFMADSGGGKSTSAILAVLAGWDFISDDFVYIDRHDDRHRAHGLRSTVCLRDDAADHFPELIAISRRRHIDHKYRLPSEIAFPGQVKASCHPVAIVVPSVADESTSRIEPISRSEVLAEAMRQSGPFLVDRTTVARQMASLRDLIEGCRCVRLRAGTDILDDPGILAGLISDLSTKPGR